MRFILTILKSIVILVVIVILFRVVWSWAMRDDKGRPIGPDVGKRAQEAVREQITSVLGQAETVYGTAKRRVQEFNKHVDELQNKPFGLSIT